MTTKVDYSEFRKPCLTVYPFYFHSHLENQHFQAEKSISILLNVLQLSAVSKISFWQQPIGWTKTYHLLLFFAKLLSCFSFLNCGKYIQKHNMLKFFFHSGFYKFFFWKFFFWIPKVSVFKQFSQNIHEVMSDRQQSVSSNSNPPFEVENNNNINRTEIVQNLLRIFGTRHKGNLKYKKKSTANPRLTSLWQISWTNAKATSENTRINLRSVPNLTNSTWKWTLKTATPETKRSCKANNTKTRTGTNLNQTGTAVKEDSAPLEKNQTIPLISKSTITTSCLIWIFNI